LSLLLLLLLLSYVQNCYVRLATGRWECFADCSRTFDGSAGKAQHVSEHNIIQRTATD